MTSRARKTNDDADRCAFRVRRLTGADFKALMEYDWTPLVVERDTVYLYLLQDHGRYCLAAEDEGGALGYLVAARSADSRAAFIFHVHVRPDRRRRGIGRALVRALEETAARDGVGLVWFLAREEARDFYSELGYRPSHDLLDPEARRYVSKVKRTMAMAKKLSAGGGRAPE